jgi:beta-glucosidase
MALDFRAFAFYHPGHKQWITEDGQFDLLIGASATDIRCTQTITLQSTMDLPSLLDDASTMREWLADPRGKVVFEPLFQQIVSQMQQATGGEAGQTGAIGMDMVGFMMDMPLVSVLHFQEALLSVTPEEMAEDLLKQVK